MNQEDVEQLEVAVSLLDNPGFMARAANFIGTPIEKGLQLLPNGTQEKIGQAAKKAIEAALKVAVRSIDASGEQLPEASNWLHMSMVAVTGGIGGFFGGAGLVVELPITTCLMMRSIADVARSESADLTDPETLVECISVLALGGSPKNDDEAGIGYFIARDALAVAVGNAAAYIATDGLKKEGSPAIVRLILMIAERYSIQVSEKVAAQLVPVIGAIGGATINSLFLDHFQNMAKGHFLILRLERKYSKESVKLKYAEISQNQKAKKNF